MARQARDRLLSAAGDLFYAHGIRAVGVDRLLSVSGVGRASFYRHFESKDELVVDVLKHYDARWRAWLESEVSHRGALPPTVFDVLADRFAAEDFRGCLAITAMIEYPEPRHPAHQTALSHKAAVTDYLDGLIADAGYLQHEALATQFMMLVDAAIIAGLREGPPAAARARAIAGSVLAAAAKSA